MADINPTLALTSAVLAVVVLLRAYIRSKQYPRCLPLPPGPKRLPILGNALNIPMSKQWLTFQRWAEEYGDIFSISLLGQPVIVLNSVKAASDLLDKRSSKYSDRFKSTVVPLIGWDWNVALMGYGPRWRQTRRAFHEHFHQGAVQQYQPTQLSGARKFLTRLLASPGNFVHDLRYDLGATILEVSYGIKAKDADDEYIAIGERAVEGPTEALVLGALWVEFLPVLRYLPPWFPGASYQRKAAQWRQEAMALKHEPFKKAIADFRDGEGTWSLASEIVHRDYQVGGGSSAGTEELAKNVAAVTYGAGADTVSFTGFAAVFYGTFADEAQSFSTLQTFFLAMTLYPDVQRKAQAELDAVVGLFRLPEYEDQKALPYVHAIVKECLRWQNVFTLGLPHRLMEDDQYNGYSIPKGSIVLSNIWAISHNPQTYQEPDVFNPDRYFKDGTWDLNVLDPIDYAFGFGRRACPGRHFAVASIYIYVASVLHVFDIASVLHVFDIAPKRDVSGNPVQVKPDMISGVVTYPVKFECDISPRSPEAEALIQLCKSD
ncbi:cytochrome P450 [Pilatotrama ljubarskyi]|nr:cytochrome P450 [Pilatotrama ljubarskyi]